MSYIHTERSGQRQGQRADKYTLVAASCLLQISHSELFPVIRGGPEDADQSVLRVQHPDEALMNE